MLLLCALDKNAVLDVSISLKMGFRSPSTDKFMWPVPPFGDVGGHVQLNLCWGALAEVARVRFKATLQCKYHAGSKQIHPFFVLKQILSLAMMAGNTTVTRQ